MTMEQSAERTGALRFLEIICGKLTKTAAVRTLTLNALLYKFAEMRYNKLRLIY